MGLLGRRDFTLIFASYGLSALGDYLALVTLTLKVQELTGSGWAVAALLLAGHLPLVLFAPAAGLIVDRFETVKLLSVVSVLQALVMAALAFADSVPAMLGLVFLLGLGVAVTQPGLLVLIPRVAPEGQTIQANALLEIARWGGIPLGALLGGAFTAAMGARSTLLIDAGTFLVVAVAVLFLSVSRPPVRQASAEANGKQARQGIAFIWNDPVLRLVVGVLGAMVAFAAMDNVAEVFFAKGVLRAGRLGYGGLVGAWTLGIAVGAIITGRAVKESRVAPSILLGAIVGGAAVMVAAGFPSLPLALTMFAVGGIANGVDLVAMRSLIHQRVPDELQGRVFSAYYAAVNLGQIVALSAGGALLELLGARGSMLIAGAGALAVGAIGLLRYARLPIAAEEWPGWGFLPATRAVPDRPPA
ncbi:MAG TPA: MFS transporter [Actinomycetota bacterium]|jgi:MFS family permease|nr:MFS transporter [Actinomycetota bacterium]